MALGFTFLGQVAYAENHYLEAKRLQWKSYHLVKDLKSKNNLITLLLLLGEIAGAERDYREARRLYQEALSLTVEIFSSWGLQMPLARIAELLAREGDKERAVELAAVVLGQPDFIASNPKGRATRLLKQLKADLSPDVFAAAVERGQARKLEETVHELLVDLRQPLTQSLSHRSDRSPHGSLRSYASLHRVCPIGKSRSTLC